MVLARIIWTIFALVFLAAVAWAAPAVTVTPKVGPPTAAVKVTGTGFGASMPVDIYFDTQHLCLAIASGAGAISCTIKVPKEAQPQAHWITTLQRGGQGAQKAFTVRTDMPQFHGRDARHQGNNPFENTIDVGNADDLDVLWAKPIGPSSSFGSPVLADGKVYVGGRDGNLYAFNATTGAAVAGFPKATGAAIDYSTPAVGGGRVFVGTIDGRLRGYNAANGAAVAGFPKTLGGIVWSSPALALGNVYVGCNDGKLYAFNATTGATVPGFPVTMVGATIDVTGSPTVFNGKVYLGAAHLLHGFDALTGVAIAGFPKATGGPIFSTVAAASGMGFFGSNDNNLWGIRLSDALNLSSFPSSTTNDVNSSPAIAGGKVFVSSTDSNVYANFTSGEGFAWSSPLSGVARGSPMAANGVLYVNNFERVYALSAANGGKLWSAAARSDNLNSPVVANGMVYFASSDGNLYAYSVHGEPVSARLPGGALGVKPALSSLKPNLSLQPVRTPED